MAKTLKKRKKSKIKKRKQSHKQRRTRQRTNNKTRGRRRRTSRKMRGGVRGASQDLVSDSPYALWQEPAVETDAGAVSGGESPFDFLNNPQPAPTAAVAPATQPAPDLTAVAPATPTAPVQTPVAPATQPAPDLTAVAPATPTAPVQQPQPAVQPVEASGPPAVQQVVQEPQVQSTVQVVQQQVQTGQLTRQQAQRARRKKAVDLMKETQKAVIEAGHGEADLARESAVAAAAAATAAAAAAAKKAKPYAKMAAATALAAAAAPLALSAVPVAAGLAGVGAGAMAGKFAVNKTMQLGKLAKKATDIKTLIWAIKVLTKEGWQFILPGQTVATTLELAIAWIKVNYKSVKEAKPDPARLDGTPTPGSV
jgi:hypothetical protein